MRKSPEYSLCAVSFISSLLLAVVLFEGIPIVQADSPDMSAAIWPCGLGLPSGSTVYPSTNRIVLPNGTQMGARTDCQQNVSSFPANDAVTEANAYLPNQTPSWTQVGPSLNYCTGVTSCTLTGTVTTGDVIAVAMQGPSGGTVGVHDTYAAFLGFLRAEVPPKPLASSM